MRKMNPVSHDKYMSIEVNTLTPAPQSKKIAKKSLAKRAASLSNKSPSSSKRVRSASPAKAASAPAASRARSHSPIKESPPRRRRRTSPPPRPPHPNERGRDNIISPTNPQMIESLNKPNPFHETLPAPEIWHRRMPPYLPFGETPFMEREISRQIEEDLARGKRSSSFHRRYSSQSSVIPHFF